MISSGELGNFLHFLHASPSSTLTPKHRERAGAAEVLRWHLHPQAWRLLGPGELRAWRNGCGEWGGGGPAAGTRTQLCPTPRCQEGPKEHPRGARRTSPPAAPTYRYLPPPQTFLVCYHGNPLPQWGPCELVYHPNYNIFESRLIMTALCRPSVPDLISTSTTTHWQVTTARQKCSTLPWMLLGRGGSAPQNPATRQEGIRRASTPKSP